MILFNGFNYKKIHRKLYHLGLQKQKKLKKKKKKTDGFPNFYEEKRGCENY
jgi:hypothetical protein